MQNPTPEFPLADLTSTMMREVFEAISSSSMEQAQAYAEIAAKVALPYEAYLGEVVGTTAQENAAAARGYIVEVVLPLLGLPSSPIPDPVLFAAGGHDELRGLLGGLLVAGAPIDEVIVTAGPYLSIAYADLEAFVLERMRSDTNRSYRSLSALMAAGMPNVVVTGGQVCTKVTMRVSAEAFHATSGLGAVSLRRGQVALNVRVAEEHSVAVAKSMEVVGSVRIDFRTGKYPSTEQLAP